MPHRNKPDAAFSGFNKVLESIINGYSQYLKVGIFTKYTLPYDCF